MEISTVLLCVFTMVSFISFFVGKFRGKRGKHLRSSFYVWPFVVVFGLSVAFLLLVDTAVLDINENSAWGLAAWFQT